MKNLTDYYREIDLASLWRPYTRLSALRDGIPVMTRGEGVFLFDSAGNRYVDAISSWWAWASVLKCSEDMQRSF